MKTLAENALELTIVDFSHLQNKLKTWRDERNLGFREQRKGLVANLLEEATEYQRAQNHYERVDALCDMCVFAINAIDRDMSPRICVDAKDTSPDLKEMQTNGIPDKFSAIVVYIGYLARVNLETDKILDVVVDGAEMTIEEILHHIVGNCFDIIKVLGFDPLKAMGEVLKEISSRTGEYNDDIGKFVKDKGAYSLEEAESLTNLPFKEEDERFWYFRDDFIKRLDKIAKWYKADFDKCSLALVATS